MFDLAKYEGIIVMIVIVYSLQGVCQMALNPLEIFEGY